MSVTAEYLRLLYETKGERALAESRAKLVNVARSARHLAAQERAGLITNEQFEGGLRAVAKAAARLRADLAGLERLSHARAAASQARGAVAAADPRPAFDAAPTEAARFQPSTFDLAGGLA